MLEQRKLHKAYLEQKKANDIKKAVESQRAKDSQGKQMWGLAKLV